MTSPPYRRAGPVVAAMVAVLAGCTSGGRIEPRTAPPPATGARLVSFDSCGDLLRELRAAVRASRAAADSAGAVAEPPAVADGARAQTAAPTGHSGTTTHEPD